MLQWLRFLLCSFALVSSQEPLDFDTGMTIITGGIRAINTNVFSERNRRQCLIFDGREDMFPCKYLDKSKKKPKSVHKLRPGDIDVVGALGDSITSGIGVLGRNLLQISREYRGASFSIGGLGNWQEFLTLPNILKNFNPQIKGFSLAITEGYSNTISGFNMAQAGSKTFNMSTQARRLVRVMRSDPRVDFYNDWKMITILVGHNDVCSAICERPTLESATETGHLAEALDILYHDLPRTLVNLMPIADLTLLYDVKKIPLTCFLLRKWLCPCLFSPIQPDRLNREQVTYWLDDYLKNLDSLVASGRYDKRDDFTVVLQPTMVQASLPMRGDLPDLDFLGPDCFHFGQRAHALMARGLWNNLLQPVGQKSMSYDISVPFLCPSKERPYLATSRNSASVTRSEVRSNMKDFVTLMGTLPAQASRCPI